MKNFFTILTIFVVCMLCLMSCDEEYDLNNDINTEITVGGDFLAFPIGGTKKIKLSELLDIEDDDDVIQALDNGNYAIKYKDEIIVDGLSVPNVSIKGVTPEIPTFIFSIADVTVPSVIIPEEMVTETTTLDAININVAEINIPLDKTIDLPNIPAIPQDIPNEGKGNGEILGESFETDVEVINIDMGSNDNVSSVSTVYFGATDVGDRFTFELDASSLITKLPNVTVQKISGVTITFPVGTKISATQGAVVGNIYSVNERDMVGGKITFEIFVESLQYRNGSTMGVKFEFSKLTIKADGPRTAILSPKIVLTGNNSLNFRNADIVTKDISLDIEGRKINLPLNIEGIENIATINYIEFKDGSNSINLSIEKPNLSAIAPLDITSCSDLNIIFPPSIEFKKGIDGFNYNTNTLTLTYANIFGARDLEINKLTLNKDVEDNKLEYNVEMDISGITFTVGSQTINTSVVSNGLSISYESGIKESTIKVANASVVTTAITAEIALIDDAEIAISEKIPSEITKLVTVKMAEGAGGFLPLLDISTTFTGIPTGIDKISLDNFSIEFPSVFEFLDDPEITGSVFTSNADILRVGDKFLFSKKIYVKSFNLGQDNNYIEKDGEDNYFNFTENVKIKGAIVVPGSTISSKDLKDITGTPSVKLGEMSFSAVEGIFSPKVDPINEMFELKDLPDFLVGNEDMILDLINPTIKFEVSNTLNIPIIAIATITPIIKDIPQTEDMITATLNIKRDDNGTDVPMLTKFWLSEDEPSDPTYEYIYSDIGKLITQIPEFLSIDVDVSAEEVSDESDESENHTIDLSKTYDVKINYEVEVPLTLGDDFKLIYTDTLSGLGKDLEDVIDKISSLLLEIDIENSVPLNMGFSMTPLDENLKTIEGIDVVVEGDILSGKADPNSEDGSGTMATKSAINVELTETQEGQLAKLDNLLISVTGDVTEKTEKLSLNKEQYLMLSLKAKVPGGISMDIDE